ncbi:TniB family NTP-binding protein [Bradyrhizobium sp. WYCCWR 13022]|uniref:TniB family NTP-binding protein n=1 Tax=unclassified Bradyrhizobium TaxID=2631580 RepID=UPI00263BA322|nr:TniB family NTP-binding protein [Bradyrhizobium sp. WYCCWR 13022]MDN4982173.1 TniB family NTP-binding protein [Bradyrhizobium sp. WYCCWR 13022]
MNSKPTPLPALAAPPPLTKAELILLPIEDRLASIDRHVFYTPEFGKAVRSMKHVLYERTTSGLHTNIVMHGPEGSGKTSLAEHFLSQNPPIPADPIARQPVLFSKFSRSASARDLAHAVLASGGWPQVRNSNSDELAWIQIKLFLEKVQARLLILNHADRLMRGDAISEKGVDLLEDLLDLTPCPIMIIGQDGFGDVIEKCDRLAGRFPLHLPISRMPYGKDWLTTCNLLNEKLPFRTTEILTDEMPERLQIAAAGGMPDLMRLTQAASRIAIFGEKSLELTRRHYLAAFACRPGRGPNPFDKIPLETLRMTKQSSPTVTNRAAVLWAKNRSDSS